MSLEAHRTLRTLLRCIAAAAVAIALAWLLRPTQHNWSGYYFPIDMRAAIEGAELAR